MAYLDSTGVTYLTSDIKAKADADYQAKLVSGTNIKTINGSSVLGSGDLTVSGGVEVITTTATLTVAGWSSNTQTVNVTGVTASNAVLVTYAPASKDAYTAADIYCTAQGAGTLTFACTTTPTSAITVNVMIVEGGVIVVDEYKIYPPGADSFTTINGVAFNSSTYGYFEMLTGETVEVVVGNDAIPAPRPGQTGNSYTLNIGSTSGEGDIATFSGLIYADKTRSFIMPACDVYISFVKET